MAVQALTNFLKISTPAGVVQGRYQNGRPGEPVLLDGEPYHYLSFLYSGAAKNRTGDNLEAGLTLACNKLAMAITTQAVDSGWVVEAITCSMHPTTWAVGRVLAREVWVATAQSYDPVQVEVVLSSGIDAVGASAPTRVLTSKLVGALPFSGAIQNL